jgi:hypothetical protein
MDRGVWFSTFSVYVDSLSALRITRSEEDQLFDGIPVEKPKVSGEG